MTRPIDRRKHHRSRAEGPQRWDMPAVVLLLLIALATVFSACDDDSSSVWSPLGTESTAAGGTTAPVSTAGTSATAVIWETVIDVGRSEMVDPDPSTVVESNAHGWAPTNNVLVLMEQGQGRAQADEVAAQLGGSVVGEIELLGLYQIQTSDSSAQDLDDAIEKASSLPGVESAVANGVAVTKAAAVGKVCSPMWDPVYQTNAGYVPYQMIGMVEAQHILQVTGVALNPVRVGVVDTAVYTRSGHSLAPELHFPDANGDLPEGEVCVGGLRPEDATDQPDDNEAGLSHGTQVTHVIAADWDDGVVGVAAGLRDKLTVAVSNDEVPGLSEWLQRGELDASVDLDTYAAGYFGTELARVMEQVSKGATVINMSFGAAGTPDMKNERRAQIWRRLFELVYAKNSHVLFVAAAGNENAALNGSNFWPGGMKVPNLITVGALDRTGDRAKLSDWAHTPESLDAATRAGSNYATGYGEVTISACGTELPVGRDPRGDPVVVSGTSVSAPQVTAAAAILQSLDPQLTAEQIKDILVRTGATEVTIGGKTVAVPAEVGGRVLRVDKAVLEVINQMRGPGNEFVYEELRELATVRLIIMDEDGEYTIMGSVPRTGPEGVDLTISVVGDAELIGKTTAHVADSKGYAMWTIIPKGKGVTVKVHRSDTGLCAFANLGEMPAASTGSSSSTQPQATNRAPVAEDIITSTSPGASVPTTLRGSDADGDDLTYKVIKSPPNGTLSGTAPFLTYKPNANASGTDSFTYKVNDGKADSAVATVKIEVEGLRWVRVGKAAINPEKLPLEFRGGGSDPTFFPEERFKDMLVDYSVSETSFTVRDRWQDREYVAWDITVNCDFDPPEAVLMPGRSYKLNVKFSHSGKTTEIPAGEAFTYFSTDAGIEPDEPFAYAPWDPKAQTVSSKTYTLTAPQGRAGDTMQIQAGWWNAAQCTVIWTYKLQ